jgi:ABC-type proline/glycine betaine transport system permease subunit
VLAGALLVAGLALATELLFALLARRVDPRPDAAPGPRDRAVP